MINKKITIEEWNNKINQLDLINMNRLVYQIENTHSLQYTFNIHSFKN